MALPSGVALVTNIKGDPGKTGTLAFLTAETIPWTEPPTAEMVGPESNRGAHLGIPIPVPGPELLAMRDATLDAADRAEAASNATVGVQDGAVAVVLGEGGNLTSAAIGLSVISNVVGVD